MNNDLISRSVLKDIWELYERYQPRLATNVLEFGDALKEIIDNVPTIKERIEYGTDGKPYILSISNGSEYSRPTGEWIKGTDEETGKIDIYPWTCSECKGKYPWQPNYCPRCGTKMKGVENDN